MFLLLLDAAPADVADLDPHLWVKSRLSDEFSSGPGGD